MTDVQAQMAQAMVVFVSAIFTQNILLTYFLGLCPFIGVSREIKTAFGLGIAVIFVMVATTLLNWLAYHYVLVPLKLEFFRFILFIIIIAAFVQFIEMAIDRYSPVLYQNLGVFLPLITVNCAILGAALFMVYQRVHFHSNNRLQSWQRYRMVFGDYRDVGHQAKTCKRTNSQRSPGAGDHAYIGRIDGTCVYRLYRCIAGKIVRSNFDAYNSLDNSCDSQFDRRWSGGNPCDI